jgi:hypothetical protein
MASASRPRLIVQIVCATIALLGFLPWALVLGEAMLQAIESPLPLQHSLMAWLVLLVPLWVIWFAIVSWRKRNETVMPAMLMAAPAVFITLLAIAMPLTSAAP